MGPAALGGGEEHFFPNISARALGADFHGSTLVRCPLITGMGWAARPGVGHVLTLEDAGCPHQREGYGFWRGRNDLAPPPPYSLANSGSAGGGGELTAGGWAWAIDIVSEKVIKMLWKK